MTEQYDFEGRHASDKLVEELLKQVEEGAPKPPWLTMDIMRAFYETQERVSNMSFEEYIKMVSESYEDR
ncbi:MAG: hypothetical protein CL489_10305 [Acidobacteria bacterium]|nr:hypothetical protein [Acidobacteriota bacterium]